MKKTDKVYKYKASLNITKIYLFIFIMIFSLILQNHSLVLAESSPGVTSASLNKEEDYRPGVTMQRREIEYWWAYDKTAICSQAGGASTTSAGVDELEGHKLPAATGGTGLEESINESGAIPSGGKVTFSGFAKLGQNYRDFYITMRWRYRLWAWNGHSQKGPEDVGWYSAQPRKVLVTNPENGKSIVAAILESGPAPWTGTPEGKGNPPAYWQGFIDGTPGGYKGRVAGFPPAAFDYLGDGADIQRYKDGSGPDLIYKWADQNAEPGPTNVSAGGAPAQSSAPSGSAACGGGQGTGGQGVGQDGFVFPLQTTRSTLINHQPDAWCYNNETNCHHHYNAADIFAPTGTIVLAAKPGTVTRTNYSGKFGQNVQIKGDDGYNYYYTHMPQGANKVNVGDKVTAGQPIGEVGTNANAAGTTHHLHFDITTGDSRPSCSGAACSDSTFQQVQPLLISAFNNLPE